MCIPYPLKELFMLEIASVFWYVVFCYAECLVSSPVYHGIFVTDGYNNF